MDIAAHLPEIIIVLVIVLIIWGPGKLPDVGAAMGRGIREFRKASAQGNGDAGGAGSGSGTDSTVSCGATGHRARVC